MGGIVTRQSLLTAQQAAEVLNVPASWVLAEARSGRIPHVRLGRYVRFELGELEVWWRSRARGPWRSRGVAAEQARGGVAGADPVPRHSESLWDRRFRRVCSPWYSNWYSRRAGGRLLARPRAV